MKNKTSPYKQLGHVIMLRTSQSVAPPRFNRIIRILWSHESNWNNVLTNCLLLCIVYAFSCRSEFRDDN